MVYCNGIFNLNQLLVRPHADKKQPCMWMHSPSFKLSCLNVRLNTCICFILYFFMELYAATEHHEKVQCHV